MNPMEPTKKTGRAAVWLMIGLLCVTGLLVGCVNARTGGAQTQDNATPASEDDTPPDGNDVPGQPGTEGANANEDSTLEPGDGVVPDDVTDGASNESADDTGDGEPDEPAYEDPPTDDLLDGTDNAEYLSTLAVAHARTGGRTFLIWVVDEPDTRQRGLMFVTEEELADLPDGRSRGMLFVYNEDARSGFWMRNTIAPLDIAYIEADGRIVTIHTMAPLDESVYYPDGPYRYALEVNAGAFAELGVQPGDFVELP
ncbi:MAG TPA: DUF192 domain-containing protein [Phycisphaerae bacterium]|nr:DUF192 domain-containing protein [Phycisphaerae bacterium]